MKSLRILWLLALMTGCIPVGDSGAHISGQLQFQEDSVSHCVLQLHLIHNDTVVGQVNITTVFSETFVIKPDEDDYYVTIKCEGYTGKYRSPPLKLGSVNTYKEGINLGTITIDNSEK